MSLKAIVTAEFEVYGKTDEEFIKEASEIVGELNDRYDCNTRIIMIHKQVNKFEQKIIYPNNIV